MHTEIVAQPKGKKTLSIEQLSGGEKALTAHSPLFALSLVTPCPLCILDEVDAHRDNANVTSFIKLLKKFENNTQFIIVTHNNKHGLLPGAVWCSHGRGKSITGNTHTTLKNKALNGARRCCAEETGVI